MVEIKIKFKVDGVPYFSEGEQTLATACLHLRDVLKDHDAPIPQEDALLFEAIESRAEITAERQLRPAVQAFAEAMERKLRKNEHKGGWKDCTWDWLYSRMTDEMCELARAARAADHDGSKRGLLEEAADVANFAMMIADVCGALLR